MEKAKESITQDKIKESSYLVYATNIGVVAILGLCIIAYFVVEKEIYISENVCHSILNNSKFLTLAFFCLTLIPNWVVDLFYKDNTIAKSVAFKTYRAISFACSMLYFPVYIIYLMMCQIYI